jgi:hypothetical protein
LESCHDEATVRDGSWTEDWSRRLGVDCAHVVVPPLVAGTELRDTPASAALFFVSVAMAWAGAGFLAYRRTPTMRAAAGAGLVAALVTVVGAHFAVVVLQNLFLEVMSRRADWPYLLSELQRSDFVSLRAYVSYGAIRMFVPALAAGIVVGAVSGAAGGAVAHIRARISVLSGRGSAW